MRATENLKKIFIDSLNLYYFIYLFLYSILNLYIFYIIKIITHLYFTKDDFAGSPMCTLAFLHATYLSVGKTCLERWGVVLLGQNLGRGRGGTSSCDQSCMYCVFD